MKISVSMIVKNEEKCLARCLESIKDFDEIVILDTGSTDGTSEIAKKYTDKYFENEYKWNDNFAEARNYANKKCTGDWIFVLDADEVLEEYGLDKIKLAIQTNKKSVDCIVQSSTKTCFHYAPRLYRNNKDIFWVGAIHNHLNISENNRNDIKVIYNYSENHKKDPDRTLRILKKEVDKNPKLVRELYYLAREYSYRKDWINTLYWIKEYLKNDSWAPERAEAFLLMARTLWNLRRGEEARDACLQAIKINANFKEAIEFMAELSGPKNKPRWLLFSQTATNDDVLFIRPSYTREATT